MEFSKIPHSNVIDHCALIYSTYSGRKTFFRRLQVQNLRWLGAWHPPIFLFDGYADLVWCYVSLNNFFSSICRCKQLSILVRIYFPHSPLGYAIFGESYELSHQKFVSQCLLNMQWWKYFMLLLQMLPDILLLSMCLWVQFWIREVFLSFHLWNKSSSWHVSSPNSLPHNGLAFHRMKIPLHTNNSQCYGISYRNNNKQEMSFFMRTSWYSYSSFLNIMDCNLF